MIVYSKEKMSSYNVFAIDGRQDMAAQTMSVVPSACKFTLLAENEEAAPRTRTSASFSI
jgi:hypothetical protein